MMRVQGLLFDCNPLGKTACVEVLLPFVMHL